MVFDCSGWCVWINVSSMFFGLMYKTLTSPHRDSFLFSLTRDKPSNRLVSLLSSAAQRAQIYKYMPIRTTSRADCSLSGVWWDGPALFPADKSPTVCAFADFAAVILHAELFQTSVLCKRGIVANLAPCWKLSISSKSICPQPQKSKHFYHLFLRFCYLKAHVLAMCLSHAHIFVHPLNLTFKSGTETVYFPFKNTLMWLLQYLT